MAWTTMKKPFHDCMEFISTLLICLSLIGCSEIGCCLKIPVSGNDSIHYLIFGLGIVSIPKANENSTKSAIFATKTQSLGVIISDQPGAKVGVGYTSGSVINIPDGAHDVQIEISPIPGGGVSIISPTAILK